MYFSLYFGFPCQNTQKMSLIISWPKGGLWVGHKWSFETILATTLLQNICSKELVMFAILLNDCDVCMYALVS